MDRFQKIIFSIIAIGVVCTFVLAVIAIKQHFTIKDLIDDNIKCETTLANLKQEMNSPEYNAIQKCRTENYWRAECIAWELNNGK